MIRLNLSNGAVEVLGKDELPESTHAGLSDLRDRQTRPIVPRGTVTIDLSGH